MSVWLPDTAFNSAEIPGLLSGMGVINTVAVFAYSTALNRVSGIKYRRWAAVAFVVAWLATSCVVLAYVLHSYWGWNSGALVDAGLLLWALSFPTILILIYLASRDSVGRGTRLFERNPLFLNRFGQGDFGVPAIDAVLVRALRLGGRVTYPFLLIHDIGSPGLKIGQCFVQAALLAGEAVIYLSFSRPHRTVRQQIARLAGVEAAAERMWIIDCYAPIYMPEELFRADRKTLFADARDPSDVYTKYMTALSRCRLRHTSVRSVHETLSDFIKIADADLVMHYLRRVVVLEETRHIRSLYLFWQDAVQGNVDQRYLRWFFSTTLEATRPETMNTQNISFRLSNIYPEPVVVSAASDLGFDESGWFQPRYDRVGAAVPLLQKLAYQPRPYGFLPAYGGPDRAFHLVNFVFFMVAIDHDTHERGRRYEAVVDGSLRHGSDLLYAMAQRAKAEDPALFLPDAFATLDDATMLRMFTAPNGAIPADLGGRAALLRHCAGQLHAQYGSDASNLLRQANLSLAGPSGLFALLAGFDAYRDPVRKKASLLAKILMRERLFAPQDPQSLPVAIDHVVMTMALRGGLVACLDEAARQDIEAGKPLDHYRIDVLRDVTDKAMQALVVRSGIAPDRIDDLFWSYGRQSLRRPTPLDQAERVHSDLDPLLQSAALPGFIAFINGIDGAGDDRWPRAATVRGSFTRFY